MTNATTKTQSPRRRYLLDPRIQLGATALFLGTAALYVLLQGSLLYHAITSVGERHPEGSKVMEELLAILRYNLLGTLVVMVPLTWVVGIYMTHRVVGPLHRFREYLTALAQGRDPGPCRIRRGDELQDLCTLLNDVTAPLREEASRGSEDENEPPLPLAG